MARVIPYRGLMGGARPRRFDGIGHHPGVLCRDWLESSVPPFRAVVSAGTGVSQHGPYGNHHDPGACLWWALTGSCKRE